MSKPKAVGTINEHFTIDFIQLQIIFYFITLL